QAGPTPSSRKVALSSTSSCANTRSGSEGARMSGRSTSRPHRPLSPSKRSNRSSHSVSIPTRRAPDGSETPNPSRHSSGSANACCTRGVASTSSPSGSIASTSAPSRASSAATKLCMRPISGGVEFVAEQRVIQRLDVLVLSPRREKLVLDLRKGGRPPCVRFLQPRIEHETGEVLLLFELAEDGADLAHHQFEHVDLFVEDAQHRVLDRSRRGQIEHVHLAR